MHLYDAGVPLPYIRDILGHVDLSTIEIYARASTEAKRKALDAAYVDVVPQSCRIVSNRATTGTLTVQQFTGSCS